MKKALYLAAVVAIFAFYFGCAGAKTTGSSSQTIDVTGTWAISVETPSGKGNPTFVFVQKDGKISGTYKGAFGESSVSGKISGNKFSLSYTSNDINITYEGKVEGNKMSGTASFGQYGNGPFTGEKK